MDGCANTTPACLWKRRGAAIFTGSTKRTVFERERIRKGIEHCVGDPRQEAARMAEGRPQPRLVRLQADLDPHPRVPLRRPAPTTGPHRLGRQGAASRRLDTRGTRRDRSCRQERRGAPPPAFYKLKTRGLTCTSSKSMQQQGAICRACVCAVLLDSTETWSMSSSDVYRATERLPRVRTPSIVRRCGTAPAPPSFSTDSAALNSRRWRTAA